MQRIEQNTFLEKGFLMKNRCLFCLVIAGVACVATQAPAAVVAQYRFEDNLTSEANSPDLDASFGSGADFSTDVPGALILDGVGGAASANTRSYVNNSVPGTGSFISDGGGIFNSTVNTGGFTIEAFVRIDSSGSSAFDLIFGNLNSVGDSGFSFGLNGAGNLRFGAPNANAGGFQAAVSDSALSVDEWVHVAAVGTFTERSEPSPGAGGGFVDFTDVQLFVDYVESGDSVRFFGAGDSEIAGNIGPVFATSAANFTIGADNPFDGLIDELRISNTALASDALLRASAIPEPTSACLVAAGLLGMIGFGRRRK